MGGKGRKRREKNYRAAHGGPTRLPPPPKPSQIDALPSKLRQLIAFTSNLQGSTDIQLEKKRNIIRGADGDSTLHKLNKTTRIKDGGDDGRMIMPQNVDNGDETVEDSENGKKKKKRKRKEINDLRFEAVLENSATRSKRKERKKKYLEAKKNKHKKAKTEENLGFPGHEKVEFGDVVKAPPKLVTLPKGFKTDASQERLRLQAVEAYRSRKGWTSRPGVLLPPVTTSPSS
ncbi:hypothetical protein Dsin_026279 [Dipteronia sinensis]|uniref:Uncharacterized protein n=1 Tax=Dipteronia sinensis TaxID=43782 RepID=A0AAD9ZYF2_9ROSI|nr:hypothetical protein Dsin_026279 [Dipteronia sinensis]